MGEVTYDAQLAFLKKLIDSRDFSIVDDKRIKYTYFNVENAKVFKFICKYFSNYGEIPKMSLISRKFPHIARRIDDAEVDEEITIQYLADDLKYDMLKNILYDTMDEVDEGLEDFKETGLHECIETSMELLNKAVVKINDNFSSGERSGIGDEAKRILTKFIDSDEDEIPGVPTGYPQIDYMTMGVKPGDFWTIFGFTNVGKTILILIMAIFMASMGVKITFVTREMSVNKIAKRVIPMWMKYPLGDFNRRNFSNSDKSKIREFIENNLAKFNELFIIEESTGGLTNLATILERNKGTQVLFIDGLYLMTEDAGDDDWKAISSTWRGVKKLALANKVGVIATMQLKSNKASLNNISMARNVAQDIDVGFGISKEEDESPDTRIITSMKQRDSEVEGNFIINWDFRKMDFRTIITHIPGFDEWQINKRAKEKGRKIKPKPKLKSKTVKKKKLKVKWRRNK